MNIEEYRQNLAAKSQEEIKLKIHDLIVERSSLNEEEPTTIEQLERIESDLAIIQKKLDIAREILRGK
jgi:hypothetical protein